MVKRIEIVEVGPRDGLQNDSVILSTENKITLIKALMDAGIKRLEVASFVHPKLVPQMADAEDVIAGLPKRAGVSYIGLVLNERGLLRALETRKENRGITEVGCVALPSDTFGMKNQGQTSKESVEVACGILKKAKAESMDAQVTISSAFGCPFEGEVSISRIVEIAKEVAQFEPTEIALADTIGVAVPAQVLELFRRVSNAVPDIPLRGHFHNTRNTGVANSWAAVEAGAKSIDASIGGLGGCPFAPKATGNVATEDIVYLLDRSGVETGVQLDKLFEVNALVEKLMGRELSSLVARAGNFPPQAKRI